MCRSWRDAIELFKAIALSRSNLLLPPSSFWLLSSDEPPSTISHRHFLTFAYKKRLPQGRGIRSAEAHGFAALSATIVTAALRLPWLSTELPVGWTAVVPYKSG